MKRLSLLVLLAVFVAFGCSQQPAQETKEAPAKGSGVTYVTIGTGGVTGVYYPTGGAISRVVNKKNLLSMALKLLLNRPVVLFTTLMLFLLATSNSVLLSQTDSIRHIMAKLSGLKEDHSRNFVQYSQYTLSLLL